ncbi:MAG: asparagine synthase (glutamine-hydrolyzing), partial [Deltaproteobacteria bacterium]|nr:asparagine synthase (glutamine-hydrolyzing) [Deltaproteobacteria bacterium]
ELRRELKSKGHCFTSQTDSEVILHLYEEEYTDCVKRLRGMFAFALWDQSRRQLMLSRDRAGQKPLVYAADGKALIFASEIKALLQDPAVAAEVDPEAIHHYLTYQYIPGPGTIFKGIKKLPPAHTLILKNGTLSLEPYWQLSYEPKLVLNSETEYTQHLLDVFRESVKIRLRSDVPLGAFLSGGIDSSATVAMMSELLNRPVKTFSIGFEEQDFNELQYARQVAERYQTEHTEFVVKPDALKVLPTLIRHYDEPYADPSAVPTYYVSQLTREHVTVALNGDGADESFAGYERYAAHRLAGCYEKLPAWLRNGLIKPAVNRLPYREQRWSISRRLKRFINGVTDTPQRRYIQWFCYFNNAMKQQLYTPAFMQAAGTTDSVDITARLYEQTDARHLIDKTLFVDIMSYLPYDLLPKVDIASMAVSLEARSPFLDHKLMEFAARLPLNLKLRGMQTKYLLKKTFAPYLPADILKRKKMGFGVPLNRWFCRDLKPVAYDILLSKQALGRGYFQREVIEQLLSEHVALQADHSYRLWALLWLELWHRMFVDKTEVLGI